MEPLIGFAPLVLGVAGLAVLEGPADRPELTAPPALIRLYFLDGDTVILGSFLMMLAALAFMWFAGDLRATLAGGEGRLSTIAFGGAVTAAGFMLAMPAVNVLGALVADRLTGAGAQTVYFLGDAFLYPAAMASAVFVAATALAALRTDVLPRWSAWTSLVLAAWLIIPPIGGGVDALENPAAWTGLAVLPLVPAWIALVAGLLLRRGSSS
jgi:hypothetical protein